ncbi:hypothetical protein SAMN06265360_12160 [Haloechinothrix alba]|uniref:MftR C-terminal domain-containing protein n=1 Tax=Haloechinothrix alba TaxID=664784 RepID=A0A238ZIL5_9PSEU|nr:hypothetical protein [Haloechinothrix alba]SNR82544.1 hypothetical protein SAMN06265360_12160 [Haloechinothrix alba]
MREQLARCPVEQPIMAAVRAVVAGRLALDTDALIPRTTSHTALGVCIAAYEHWLTHSDAELTDILDAALATLASRFNDLA